MAPVKTLHSMTGYASVSRDSVAGRITVELRSVNSRFLDLAFRMPDDLRGAEPGLRDAIAASVHRGKLDCRIALQKLPVESRQLAIDRGLLAQVVAAASQIAELAPQAAPLTQADLLRWPGVLAESASDPDSLLREVVSLGQQAVRELVASRQREGARLVEIIRESAAAIRGVVAQLKERTPELLSAFEQKLTERLKSALVDATRGTTLPLEEIHDRVRQEVVLHGLRIDVAEELDRLGVHLDELERIVSGSGQAGKRLDFLMQELNREANTLGSKAASIDLTQAAVDLKLLIERIREQVQNLE